MKKLILTSMLALSSLAAHAETIAPVMKQPIPEAPGKNVLIATVSYKPGQAPWFDLRVRVGRAYHFAARRVAGQDVRAGGIVV
jgi:hypothetical protein